MRFTIDTDENRIYMEDGCFYRIADSEQSMWATLKTLEMLMRKARGFDPRASSHVLERPMSDLWPRIWHLRDTGEWIPYGPLPEK